MIDERKTIEETDSTTTSTSGRLIQINFQSKKDLKT